VVNQDLLVDIETYILSRWKDLQREPADPSYYFSITDAVGSEKLTSVNDYKAHLFPDDIKEATLQVWGTPAITINFDVDSIGSKVSIEMEGPNARELAHGILDGIFGSVRPFETYNYIFDPNNIVFPLLFGLGGVIGAGLAGAFIADRLFPGPNNPAIIIGTIGGAILSFTLTVLVVRLHPYTTFHTRLNQRRRTVWNWLIYGVLSSLAAAGIVAVVGRALR
jgi:hypothetical protein